MLIILFLTARKFDLKKIVRLREIMNCEIMNSEIIGE